MRIHFDMPWGGQLEIERKPMSDSRFNVICFLIGAYIIGSGLLKFFSLLIGA